MKLTSLRQTSRDNSLLSPVVAVPLVGTNPSGENELLRLTPTKSYRALLSQVTEEAPVALVLENSLGGEVVWTRSGVGVYVGTLAGAFIESKTLIRVDELLSFTDTVIATANAVYTSENAITVVTRTIDLATPLIALSDTILAATQIEVLVFP